MPQPINPNTIAALERIMQEMHYLVAHPRIQQKTWVAKGKEWLPLLGIIHGELTDKPFVPQTSNAEEPSEADSRDILIESYSPQGKSYFNVPLANVMEVDVKQGEYPGPKHNFILLRDGRKILTTAADAQRVVDTLREQQG